MKYLHTMIRILDPEVALDFFINKMGMIEVRRSENEAGRYTNFFLAGSEDDAPLEVLLGDEAVLQQRLEVVVADGTVGLGNGDLAHLFSWSACLPAVRLAPAVLSHGSRDRCVPGQERQRPSLVGDREPGTGLEVVPGQGPAPDSPCRRTHTDGHASATMSSAA